DGPLGVVSAFAAVDILRQRGVAPTRPLAIVNFSDEEGGRFGVACVGSRLMTGDADPVAMLARRDAEGMTVADARAGCGLEPDAA
ncbi:allantoate amidohydrolase, partial [Staphylococcus aureus]